MSCLQKERKLNQIIMRSCLVKKRKKIRVTICAFNLIGDNRDVYRELCKCDTILRGKIVWRNAGACKQEPFRQPPLLRLPLRAPVNLPCPFPQTKYSPFSSPPPTRSPISCSSSPLRGLGWWMTLYFCQLLLWKLMAETPAVLPGRQCKQIHTAAMVTHIGT